MADYVHEFGMKLRGKCHLKLQEKQNEKVIRSCGVAWSKDLLISESKAIMSAKLKIADITQHTLVRNEKITHKENSKGVSKTYEMKADNQLVEATIAGYKIIHKKVLKEKSISKF